MNHRMTLTRLRHNSIILLFSILSVQTLAASSVKKRAQQVMESSNMRQVVIAFLTSVQSSTDSQFDPNRYQTMEDFLLSMARQDLTDSALFFNRAEYNAFTTDPPRTIGSPGREAQPPSIDPKFLKFPIGYSIAIYPDLNVPASMTPFIWTRGLHNFKEFNAPYCGFIAFLDGHVTYYDGRPDDAAPELSEIFGPQSPYASAVRILEYVPTNWIEEAPLPVLFDLKTRPNFLQQFGPLLIMFGPATLCGSLVGLSAPQEKKTYQKVIRGAVAFTIVFFFTAILFPCVCCFRSQNGSS
jgi:hypothetical protein